MSLSLCPGAPGHLSWTPGPFWFVLSNAQEGVHTPQAILNPQDWSQRRSIPLLWLGRTALLSTPSAAWSPHSPLPPHSQAPLAQFPLLPGFLVPVPHLPFPGNFIEQATWAKKCRLRLCFAGEARQGHPFSRGDVNESLLLATETTTQKVLYKAV